MKSPPASIIAWHLRRILWTRFSAYSFRDLQIARICCESYFKLRIFFLRSFILMNAHTFSTGLASGDCAGQFKVTMPFSSFHALHVLLRCLGSLSFWRIQSKCVRIVSWNTWIPFLHNFSHAWCKDKSGFFANRARIDFFYLWCQFFRCPGENKMFIKSI
jgi:hypothetical protein